MDDFVQLTRQSSIREDEFYPIANRMYETIWRKLLPPQLVTDGLSNKVKNNVVTPPETAIPDCLTCGACCQAFVCVGVRPSDDLEADRYWNITAETEVGEIVVDRYLRRDGETLACTSLEGVIGDHVGCAIYENRPAMCRHFEAGSDRCHALRRAFGIENFLSLDEMSIAMEKLDSNPTQNEASQVIRNAQIRPDLESGEYIVTALLKSGELREVYRFDPNIETWMQFQFDGLTLVEVEGMVRSSQTSTNTGQTAKNEQ